jgi:hypothetical protein
MSKRMTWCTGLALAGALAGCGQPAAVRIVGSQGWAVGSWGQAIEVPGLVARYAGGRAGDNSVSCASPGNCAAGWCRRQRVRPAGMSRAAAACCPGNR